MKYAGSEVIGTSQVEDFFRSPERYARMGFGGLAWVEQALFSVLAALPPPAVGGLSGDPEVSTGFGYIPT